MNSLVSISSGGELNMPNLEEFDETDDTEEEDEDWEEGDYEED